MDLTSSRASLLLPWPNKPQQPDPPKLETPISIQNIHIQVATAYADRVAKQDHNLFLRTVNELLDASGIASILAQVTEYGIAGTQTEVPRLTTTTADTQTDAPRTVTTSDTQTDAPRTVTTSDTQTDAPRTVTTADTQTDAPRTVTTSDTQTDAPRTVTTSDTQTDAPRTVTTSDTQTDAPRTVTTSDTQTDAPRTVTTSDTQTDAPRTVTTSDTQMTLTAVQNTKKGGILATLDEKDLASSDEHVDDEDLSGVDEYGSEDAVLTSLRVRTLMFDGYDAPCLLDTTTG
ncbi:uncharacterized protein [Procambarus clarkii]|uniref:uncharacterized protein n=1 Tax=Procambarus clarkii TaxID=6728 RepID=UPI003742F75B